ncbi:MAG: DUF4004 family protein [Clostridium sp.]
MKGNLISKKELLEIMGISYGQLYRWKRKNLIPEEWFIKKSSYTGQETYFPKDKIIQRINKILSLKDEISLDDMAESFSPEKTNKRISSETILSRGIVQPSSLYIYKSFNKNTSDFEFIEVIIMSVIEKILMVYGFKEEYIEESINLITKVPDILEQENIILIGIQRNNVFLPMVLSGCTSIVFGEQCSEVFKINIIELIEEIKIKL